MFNCPITFTQLNAPKTDRIQYFLEQSKQQGLVRHTKIQVESAQIICLLTGLVQTGYKWHFDAGIRLPCWIG